MNNPHEQQAAAMARAGELTDGELSMSMFASREDFDKAVAHQRAGELPPKDSFIGVSEEADFENDTWTFKMRPGYRVGAGEYLITRLADAEAARSEAMQEVARLRRIAVLIGTIYAFGNFKAETFNERELEGLLRENGTFWESIADYEARKLTAPGEKHE